MLFSFLWAINSPVGDDFDGVENPMDADLLEFADVLYNRLDAAFELAPISDYLATDWLLETELMQKKRMPLPIALPGEKMPANVERFLEASKGEPLLYFDSYDALKFFFVQSLKWEDEEDSLLPDLKEFDNFVVFANPKGLLIGPDVAPYFADKRNPLYNAELAEEEAYELFCEEGLCPFDLLKYGMEHELLSEAQFPFENGKELLQENWDFVARWFLGELLRRRIRIRYKYCLYKCCLCQSKKVTIPFVGKTKSAAGKKKTTGKRVGKSKREKANNQLNRRVK